MLAQIENPYLEAEVQRAGNRMALDNIRERLQLFFDAEARITIKAADGRYRVEIEIPYQRCAPHERSSRSSSPTTSRRRASGSRTLLEDIAAELPTAVVGEARNGLEAIELLPASGAQVLLLDIQMPGMGGLEVARHLARPASSRRAMIFVTAHDHHAVEAFELNALDYLLKPVRAERLPRR